MKRLYSDAGWLRNAGGMAVKIILPLIAGIPDGVPCRVILIRRNLDEALDSQTLVLARRGENPAARDVLRSEYARTEDRATAWLLRRTSTGLLIMDYAAVVQDAPAAALRIAEFLPPPFDVQRAAAVDPRLYRNRRPI